MQTDVLHKGTALGAPALPGDAPRFDWAWVVIALCVLVTMYLALVPLGFLLWQSFFTPQTADKAAQFTFSNYTEAYGWSVTLRLSWPAVFATILILFVRAIESFEVPALVGLPVGIQVFTSSIYQAVHRYPSQVGLASAYAVTLLSITTVGVYFQSRLSSRGSKYATTTGNGFRPRQIDLGPWRR